MKLKIKAFAKINLMLDILGTLENGYHDLFMLMQSVGLYDVVELETNNSKKITLACSEPDIPADETNIAHKAAVCFFEHVGVENPGLAISIEKNIPHAAGLAGGSADGAAVIVGLKTLFAPNMSDRELIEICSRVGSDVPFCATGGTMIAQGTGTTLTYMPQLSLPNVIIVKPDCSVSTGAAYAAFDTAENIIHCDRGGMFRVVLNGDLNGVYRRVANTFEQFIDVPQRIDIKAVMRRFGAKCSCMSGSGPSVFGIFEDAGAATRCLAELKKEFPNSFLVPSVPCGTALI